MAPMTMNEPSPARRSEAARAASRSNGAKSRGPTSRRGKACSSRNALRHGLRAQRLLPAILPDWLAQMEQELLAVLAAAGLPRHGLIDQILHASFLLEEADDLIEATWRQLPAALADARDQGRVGHKTPAIQVRDLLTLLRYRSRFRASRDMAMKKLLRLVWRKPETARHRALPAPAQQALPPA